MPTRNPFQLNIDGLTFAQAMKMLEREYFLRVMAASRFNQSAAASRAGMSYSTFRERLSRINFAE